MSFGEIPGGNVRAYYKLENTTDSGPNGYTLTNVNSVSFGRGKFTNAADWGTTGTTKGFTYGSNILSSTVPSKLAVSFWFKLNSTANSATERIFFTINTKTSATDGFLLAGLYNIIAGTMRIYARMFNQVGTVFDTTIAIGTPDTNWHHVVFTYNSTDNAFTINLDRSNSVTATPPSPIGSLTSVPTVYFSIGNGRGMSGNQVFAMIDEFIVSEELYAEQSTDKENRQKYYSQAKGFFI